MVTFLSAMNCGPAASAKYARRVHWVYWSTHSRVAPHRKPVKPRSKGRGPRVSTHFAFSPGSMPLRGVLYASVKTHFRICATVMSAPSVSQAPARSACRGRSDLAEATALQNCSAVLGDVFLCHLHRLAVSPIHQMHAARDPVLHLNTIVHHRLVPEVRRHPADAPHMPQQTQAAQHAARSSSRASP